MKTVDELPRNKPERLRELLNGIQSGELQATKKGSGRLAYNPYYFQYHTNTEISLLNVMLNVGLPILRDLGGDSTHISMSEILKATKERVEHVKSSYGNIGKFEWTSVHARMNSALNAADSLHLLSTISDKVQGDEFPSTSYMLTRNGVEASPEWLYSPDHSLGCLGGIAIGGAMTGANVYAGARYGVGLSEMALFFASFTALGTGASKSALAMRNAQLAHRAYSEFYP